MGGWDPGTGRSGQRRYAGRRPDGAEVRSGRDRTGPHGAYVFRGGEGAGRSGDDPGGRHGGEEEGSSENPSHAAERFRRDLQGDGRVAGDDPAPRPAAARVSPENRRGAPGDSP